MTSVEEFIEMRGISRLCHLTPLRNLIQIARGDGLLSITELEDADRAAYDPQDLLRLDGQPGHICCSIEFPNVWYLRQRSKNATATQKLFPHWVCLAISPIHLTRPGTLFCPRNAAAASGQFVASGIEGLSSMYAPTIVGSGGRTYDRGSKPAACPTDDQAEVLIETAIPMSDARKVIVPSAAHAAEVYVALELAHVDLAGFEWIVAPECFETSLASTLRGGRRPRETSWTIESISGI